MKNLFIASGLALVTAFSLSTPSVLGQTGGDDGTVIESDMITIITGDGNRSTQRVNITSSRQRYFDAPGNDGTVIRSYVDCDVMGNDNVCEQYKVIKTTTVRGQRPVRSDRNNR